MITSLQFSMRVTQYTGSSSSSDRTMKTGSSLTYLHTRAFIPSSSYPVILFLWAISMLVVLKGHSRLASWIFANSPCRWRLVERFHYRNTKYMNIVGEAMPLRYWAVLESKGRVRPVIAGKKLMHALDYGKKQTRRVHRLIGENFMTSLVRKLRIFLPLHPPCIIGVECEPVIM